MRKFLFKLMHLPLGECFDFSQFITTIKEGNAVSYYTKILFFKQITQNGKVRILVI